MQKRSDNILLLFLEIKKFWNRLKKYYRKENEKTSISILSYCQKSRKSVLERTKVIILPFKLDQEDEDIAFDEFMSQTYRLLKKKKNVTV